MKESSFLRTLPLAPKDPILGVTEAFQADPNGRKVNLGVGVYTDGQGRLPLLHCVAQAEDRLNQLKSARGYLPIDGLNRYNLAVQKLVFGSHSPALQSGRLVTAQSLGGTGGLKLGADFLRRFHPESEVWISDPSWENHRALFEAAGFTVKTYPYYDPETHGLDFAGLLHTLEQAPSGTIVVLHACCHNPSGVDMRPEQWADVRELVADRGLIPFLDLAYQGFAQGTEADAAAVREFAEMDIPVLVANSFSKSFSLYGERVGALTVVCHDRDEALRVQSQLRRVIRTNYSNPPSHGALIVATVLEDETLTALWEDELGAMRLRIKTMRHALVEQLKSRLPEDDFSFVAEQQGMFSFSGLTLAQVHRLRQEFSIYAVDSGRICVAALNDQNLSAVVEAIACVVRT
ncbi:MAG: aspartate/tyrosine/aromatic aminotransferase [Ferrovum sp.]|nr:aspartate/tyrosine/aromatic aminotransferase [Ferrovum sp.]NDU86813.1 aspartate/tyrosine/aromatic aminotransferase [Ferrovum sp.]